MTSKRRAFLCQGGLQVAMGDSNHSSISPNRLISSHPFKFGFLQDTQKRN
jgi:hypothetical protein